MPDYNLTGLSTRSFEQLVQAIAAKVIGPGVIVFGDGRDGGREATFKGAIPYAPKGESGSVLPIPWFLLTRSDCISALGHLGGNEAPVEIYRYTS